MSVEEYQTMREALWNKPLSKGQIVMITTGEYDDFCVSCVIRVIRDFDPRVELEVYLRNYPEQKAEYSGDYHVFIDWLIQRLLIERLEYREMSLGCYGHFEIEVEPSVSEVADYHSKHKGTQRYP